MYLKIFLDFKALKSINTTFVDMATVLLILGILFLMAGMLGCVLPAIPGPPLSFLGMLFLEWGLHPFSTTSLVIFGVLTVIVTVLDYLIPVWGAKIFGATKYGVWGSIIGMLAGTVLTPIGMIAGLLAGAIIGDLYGGKNIQDAFKSGIGTFLGTIAGMTIKLILSGTMTFWVFYKIIF